MRVTFRRRACWTAALSLLLLLGPAIALAQVPPARAATPRDKDDEYFELMQTFVDTFDLIERSYVKDTDRRELLEAAIKGMLGRLDPYSNYISPDELAKFNQEVDQEFGGIGIQVTDEDKRLTVISPLPGTPAYRAGIRAGDIIMEIEGKSTEGFKIDDAIKLLKGKPGEEVTIGILHPGEKKIEQIKLVREIIHVSTVLGDKYRDDGTWDFMLDDKGKIGYVRLTHFSRHSSEELTTALEQLKTAGMKGLILDLRFNPGGLLPQAMEVSDMFVESGKIVSTKGRNSAERVYEARAEGTWKDFPMAVLVNHYSASASEIVSACLQDHKRAVVIGERTWGKGSVQRVLDLEDGKSALKLTTDSYHRPSGKNIHRFPGAKDSDEWGVMPDEGFEVKLSDQELQQHLKARRERDVLGRKEPVKTDYVDKQLAKAVEYLAGQTGEAKTEKSEAKPNAGAEKKEAKAESKEGAARAPVGPKVLEAARAWVRPLFYPTDVM